MKKIGVILGLLILLTACGNTASVPTEAPKEEVKKVEEKKEESKAEAKQEDTKKEEAGTKEGKEDQIYVKDADYFHKEKGAFPSFNEEALPFDTVRKANQDLKQIYQKYLEDDDFFVDAAYDWAVIDDVVLLSIYYEAALEFDYKGYAFRIDNGEKVKPEEIYEMAGYTKEEVAFQFGIQQEGFLRYWDDLMAVENNSGVALEDYFEEARNIYKEELQNGNLSAYYDGKQLHVYTQVPYPLTEAKRLNKDFMPSKNVVELAAQNSNDDILLCVINHVTEEERKMAEPLFEYDGEAEIYAEPMLFIANLDHTQIAFQKGEYDMETFDFDVKETLFEDTLNKGQCIYIKTILPESMPNMRLVVTHGNKTLLYGLSYDGRFGGLKIEYSGETYE